MRGVYNYYAVPDQTEWYPNPATATGGQTFNVYNLDPYVWFMHVEEGISGYAFSVDDDVSNPSATGPEGDPNNHSPNNLQIASGGIQNSSYPSTPALANLNEWFPTTKWGQIQTTATIGVLPNIPKYKQYAGYSFITLTGSNPLRTLNQIITPGPGQVGAYIFAPGYIVPGTTLIFFPDGVLDPTHPTLVLSQPAVSTTNSISITINATQFKLPTVPVTNANFANPARRRVPRTIRTTRRARTWAGRSWAPPASPRAPVSHTKNSTLPLGEQQVAFIQDQGSISQSVNLAAGQAYAVSFLVDERKLDSGTFNAQPLQVSLGDQVIGTFTPSATTDGTFSTFTSTAFTVPSAGAYTITIAGKSTNGSNNMALVASVGVTGGPITP